MQSSLGDPMLKQCLVRVRYATLPFWKACDWNVTDTGGASLLEHAVPRQTNSAHVDRLNTHIVTIYVSLIDE